MSRTQKSICPSIILECLQFISDPYWTQVFTDLANNKPPNGVYLFRQNVSFKEGRKTTYVKLTDRTDYEQLHNELMDLFLNKVKLSSPLANKEQHTIHHQFCKDGSDNRMFGKQMLWSDIKKKKKKDILVELFTIDMMSKYHLSICQAEYLMSTVTLGISYHIIKPADITLVNGNISNIEGITFGMQSLVIDNSLTMFNDEAGTCSNSASKSLNNVMLSKWEKYITNHISEGVESN